VTRDVVTRFKEPPAPPAPKKKKGRGGMYGTGLKAKATKLHAEVVRARGRCEGCGSTRNLQCCHILTRSFAATRTDLGNAICGCASCHAKWTANPLLFGDFVRSLYGREHLERIQAKAYAGVKANDAFWLGEIERLSAVREDPE
jgi:hypothetical protein